MSGRLTEEIGGQLTPWVIVMAVAVVLLMLVPRLTGPVARGSQPARTSWITVAVAAVTVVVATGALVEVVRIGHSGAEATWSGVHATGG